MPNEDIAFHSLAQKVSKGWKSNGTVDVWNPDKTVGEKAKQLFGSNHVTFHEAYAEDFKFR